MNLEEVKKFLDEQKENEEVKSYLQGLSEVTLDGATNFLESDEGKKLLQPKLDSYFTKGLDSWKANNLEKLIDAEVKKRFPETDPKDIELQEVKNQLKQIQQDKLRESLKNKALTVATEKKLPVALIDYLIGDSEETTLNNVGQFEEVWNSQLQVLVSEKLKEGGITPEKKEHTATFTIDQIKNMSPEEINKNWEAVQQVMASNN